MISFYRIQFYKDTILQGYNFARIQFYRILFYRIQIYRIFFGIPQMYRILELSHFIELWTLTFDKPLDSNISQSCGL